MLQQRLLTANREAGGANTGSSESLRQRASEEQATLEERVRELEAALEETRGELGRSRQREKLGCRQLLIRFCWSLTSDYKYIVSLLIIVEGVINVAFSQVIHLKSVKF